MIVLSFIKVMVIVLFYPPNYSLWLSKAGTAFTIQDEATKVHKN